MPDFSQKTDISSYNTYTNRYTAPCDGFLCLYSGYSGTSNYLRVLIHDADNNEFDFEVNNSINGRAQNALLTIKAGYKVYVYQKANDTAKLYYYPRL